MQHLPSVQSNAWHQRQGEAPAAATLPHVDCSASRSIASRTVVRTRAKKGSRRRFGCHDMLISDLRAEDPHDCEESNQDSRPEDCPCRAEADHTTKPPKQVAHLHAQYYRAG